MICDAIIWKNKRYKLRFKSHPPVLNAGLSAKVNEVCFCRKADNSAVCDPKTQSYIRLKRATGNYSVYPASSVLQFKCIEGTQCGTLSSNIIINIKYNILHH